MPVEISSLTFDAAPDMGAAAIRVEMVAPY